MNPEIFISNIAKEAVKALYGVEADDKMIQTQATRKEFEGDITLVAFPLLKMSRTSATRAAFATPLPHFRPCRRILPSA